MFSVANAGIGVSHSQRRKKLGSGLEKCREWTGRVEISKGECLAVGIACMATYGPAPGLKRENLSALDSQQMGL